MSKILKISMIFFLLIITASLNAQVSLTKIIGSWESYKKETVEGNDGSNLTLDGMPYKATMKITFLETKECKVLFKGVNKESALYLLQDSVLTIGYQSYKIEKLTETEMVISELRNEFTSSLFLFRRYLKRLY